jgi:hypothetical protein
LLRRNHPDHDRLAIQAWLALTAPIIKLGPAKQPSQSLPATT